MKVTMYIHLPFSSLLFRRSMLLERRNDYLKQEGVGAALWGYNDHVTFYYVDGGYGVSVLLIFELLAVEILGIKCPYPTTSGRPVIYLPRDAAGASKQPCFKPFLFCMMLTVKLCHWS